MTKLGLDIARCRGVGPVSSADILLGRGLRMQLLANTQYRMGSRDVTATAAALCSCPR